MLFFHPIILSLLFFLTMKWPFLLSLYYTIQIVSAQHHVMEDMPAFNSTGEEPMSYALLPADKGYFYMHVTMMIISFWVLMPIGIMLGIAKSSLYLPIQLLSFCFAMIGFLFAKLYSHSTPHLYAGNSHHTLGWVLFFFLIVQMLIDIIRKVSNVITRNDVYQRLEQLDSSSSDRNSEASGETLHMNEFEFDKDELSTSPQTVITRLFNAVSPFIPKLIKNGFVSIANNPFTKVFCRYYHMIMGRTFIVLAFAQTLSGLIVYHGVCR